MFSIDATFCAVVVSSLCLGGEVAYVYHRLSTTHTVLSNQVQSYVIPKAGVVPAFATCNHCHRVVARYTPNGDGTVDCENCRNGKD